MPKLLAAALSLIALLALTATFNHTSGRAESALPPSRTSVLH